MFTNYVVALVVFGVLCSVSAQQYERGWDFKPDWSRLPNGIGGKVKYEKNNFNFKGNGWVDRGGNWGVGASLNWRFRRSLSQPTEVFHVHIEVDPCQFIVYDRNFDGELTRDEVMSVFVNAQLGEKLFNDLDAIERDEIVTRKEFEVMAPVVISGCIPEGLKKLPEADED